MDFTSAIIVAGGSGKRMGGDIPKQFLEINGLPVLFHTLILFDSIKEIDEIILTLPEAHIEWFKSNFFSQVKIETILKIVKGGKERQDSVKKGLEKIAEKSDYVLVHDGVRPFVTPEDIKKVIKSVADNDGVILGVPVSETIKKTDENNNILSTIPRNRTFLAQTPQGFKTEVLKRLHSEAKEKNLIVTDDASLLEHSGYRVKLVEGSRFNIKITTPDDLNFAKKLISD